MQDIAGAIAVKVENADNQHFQRSCDGKVQYETEREARRDAKAMHKKRHKRFAVYPCAYGKPHFHIGSVRSKQAGLKRSLSRWQDVGDMSSE